MHVTLSDKQVERLLVGGRVATSLPSTLEIGDAIQFSSLTIKGEAMVVNYIANPRNPGSGVATLELKK